MAKSNIYVGIDLHKRKFDFVIMSFSGEVLDQRTCLTELASVSDFASRLTMRYHVVLEPLQNGYWFIDQLHPYAGSVHLANPGKVRLIATSRMKNDRIGARILADLLRVGYLPEVYIPDDSIRQWRFLVLHRIHLVRDRTRIKNRVLGMINREGHKILATDPFGKKGRAQLDSLELSSPLRSAVDNNLTTLDLLSAQIGLLDREIEEIAESDKIVQLLRTIDGFGPFAALVVRAFVGDMSRFRNSKAFAAYTGLIPGYRQTIHTGSITKQGNPTLHWVLVQAVTHAVRRSPYLKRLYYRLCFRSSVGEARVAVAHALARMIYHVWTEARPYYRYRPVSTLLYR